MSIKSALQISVELGATPGSMAQLSRAIDKTVSGSLEQASKRSASKVSSSIQAALDQGLSSSELAGKAVWVRKLQGNLTKALLTSSDDFGKGLSRVQKAAAKEYAAHLKRAEAARESREKRMFERRKAAASEIEQLKSRAIEDQVDTYTRGLQNAHQAVMNMDFGSAAGAARGVGGNFTRIGRNLQHQGRQDDASGLQKIGGKLGGAVVAMGRMLTVVGAAVGGIALLVKSFLDIEGVVKDTNKAFVQMAGASNLALGSAGNAASVLNSRLDMLHNTINDLSFSRQWYTTPDMLKEVLGAFSEGGLTVGRMVRGLDDANAQMAKLQDSTALALTYSGLLGKSASEVAVDMGKLSFESGSTLEGIAEGFSMINKLAVQAGFDVKRFYGAVLESTTGLGLYNQRLDDAAGFLKTLSNALGQSVGADFSKQFGTLFTTSSYSDLIKEAVLTGPGLQKELRKDAQHQIRGLVQGLKDDFSSEQLVLVRDLFGKDGLLSSGDMFKAMKGMTEATFEKAMVKLAAQGVAPEVLNKYERAFDLVSGAAGRRLGDAQAAQSPVGKMIQKLKQINNVLGSDLKDLGSTPNQVELEAASAASGLDAETIRKLRMLQSRTSAAFQLARSGGMDADALLNQYGAISRDGKVFRAEKDALGNVIGEGEEIRTLNDFLRNSVEFSRLAALQGDAVSEDIKLGREISQNTNTMANVLKTGVAQYLKLIYDQVSNIYDWMSGSDERRMAKINARVKLASTSSEADRQIQVARDRITAIKSDSSISEEERRSRLAAQNNVIARMQEMRADADVASQKLNTVSDPERFASEADALAFATGVKKSKGLSETSATNSVSNINLQDFRHALESGQGTVAEFLDGFQYTPEYKALVAQHGEEKAREMVSEAARGALRSADAGGSKGMARRTDFSSAFGRRLAGAAQMNPTFSAQGVKDAAKAAAVGGPVGQQVSGTASFGGALSLAAELHKYGMNSDELSNPDKTAAFIRRLQNDPEFHQGVQTALNRQKAQQGDVNISIEVNNNGADRNTLMDTISTSVKNAVGY